jgi:LPXTG-site transpeptidase (sortase) family protein
VGGIGSAAPGSSSPTANSTPGASGVVAVRIAVPRIGIDLSIVEGDGMSAPMGRAAHFPGTAWPDAGSNTYLYGHAQEGMFLPLWQIQPGDQIVLTLVNGKKRCFAVNQIIAKAAWNDTSLLLPTDHEQLTLQTSTSYTPTAPRFVVIALPCG